jgi:hypothetical protein
MTKKVFIIDTQPGIQRDGTVFDMNFYTDGRWVRFQRLRPRKIGGYRSITNDSKGYSRGIYVNSVDGINQVFNGYNNGLEVVNIDNNGIGAGVNQFSFTGRALTLNTLVGGSGYVNATYTAVPLTGGSGSGAKATIVVSGGAVTSVTLTSYGNNYVIGNTLSASNTNLGGSGSGFSIKIATITTFTANDLNLWQFDSMFDALGSGNQLLLAHPGQNLAQIDQTTVTPVLAGDISGTTMSPLADTSGTTPTGDTIEVAGGVVVLHPYVFVYGDNGLIKNCAAGNPYDWNSADANETNVASTKIVKGLPVRGGSNAPSGLFWSLDSLIRVSFTPTTITVGASPQTFYWRYDIISSQSSILSSQSVIEYDGIYYWCGVDRFLLYNGTVKEITNTMNQNYFFDNLNYSQRQKVWVNKVPRFGEIWWFFPSGDSTECNDAIIYNIRENTWYDAGQALGARRSAGFFSQVFHYPINAGTDLTVQELVFTTTIDTTNASANIVIPSTNQVALNQLVIATGIPSGSLVIAIAPNATPNFFTVTLSQAATATATGVSATFNTTAGRVTLWQHEIGTDEVNNTSSSAIESYFETSDLGWVGGGPTQSPPVPQGGVGENYWLHLERVEPDFIQSEVMSLQVTGRPFAQGTDVYSAPYYFDPNTGKIDMREQRREIRLRFTSNVQGGNYQMGKILLSANVGDVRPYGS